MNHMHPTPRRLAALFFTTVSCLLAQSTSAPSAAEDQPVTLSPFEVRADNDRGYAATNQISGSRVNTPIKDLPIPIDVVTSQLISDIGATDLRSSLSYTSAIMLNSQNDLENGGGTYGSPYGPGGVNNPQGLTANINQVQLKVRGYVTRNVLRDGFTRAVASDSANIDRIEVVYGPNALLYGTGNLGGVVDYLTKQPMDRQAGMLEFSAGTYAFLRSQFDVTGPIHAGSHLDYRVTGAWEQSGSNIDYQKNSHYFIAPIVSWRPLPDTTIVLDTEYLNSKQKGYSFQFLRAVQGSNSTPVNNDQIEAVSFYVPPGANRRTSNLSGPDTFNNQQASNLELKLTQRLLKELAYVPSVDFLVGYNRSRTAFQTQNLNGEIFGPVAPGAPGYDVAETIFTTASANSINGQGSNNGNLVFGPLPSSAVKYQWAQNHNDATRDQERVELTAHKTLGEGKWYQFDEQVLAGVSAIRNEIVTNNWQTDPSKYSYRRPNDLSPLHFGVQGDGLADPAMYQNTIDNINVGWDTGTYLNNYAKLFSSRIILMNGVRRDKLDNWSKNTNVATFGGTPSTSTSRALTYYGKSYQNGVSLALTKHLSVYGLKAEGLEPNFGGLHNGVSGLPVGANTARSRELGLKFDFLDGKISGRISHYSITKTQWVQEPWFAPAPMGAPRFNPNKDIVYELSGGFNANGQPGTTTTFPGIGSQGAPVQTQPQVVAAWNAAVADGSVYTIPGQSGKLYLDATKAGGAAYLDAAFAANQSIGNTWPGWLYQGDSNQDPNINNATMDGAGFYNGALQPAWQVIDRSQGFETELTFTPNDRFQIVVNAALGSKVTRLNLGQWPKYPYPQDRWAVWYFQNGGFGLNGQPLSVAYTNPADTSTRTNAGVFPGDDTPKYAVDAFGNYKFGHRLTGLTAGFGGSWHSQEEFFSGVTHGGQQIEQNAAGQTIVAYSPSQLRLSMMLKYEFKSWGHAQYVQLNIDNLLNDRKRYGLIYSTPLTAKLRYAIAF
jgi:iron complex outermembrane receptor protein